MSRQPIYPELIVAKTRFVHVNDDGSETPFETGARILLRYPGSSDENRSYEVADAEGKKSVMRMSAIELLHSLQYASSEIEELIEFAEENLPGVTIGGAKHTWEELCANGYKVRSSALHARGQGNGPRP